MIPHAPRLARLHQAQAHLRRGPAAAPRPAHRPPAHDLPPGRGRDRAAQLVRPEPPEHPHPDASSGARIRRAFVAGEPGPRPAGRRLQPDRAAHPGPRLGRRASQGGLRAQGRHPPRDGRARAPQGPRRRDRGRALDGQDGQLRAGLRHERLRARRAGPTSRARRRRTSSTATSRPTRHQLLHAPHQGRGARAGLRRDAPGPPALDPRAAGSATPQLRGGGRADGHQHAHPGHGRGHHEDRHDPARTSGCAPRGSPARDAPPGPRRGAARGAARRWSTSRPPVVREDHGGRHARWTCRSTWTSRSATTGSR